MRTQDTHRTIRPTRADVVPVLRALETQCGAHILAGGGGDLKIREDWDWTGSGPITAITWEEGPYEWSYLFPGGGTDEEFGFPVQDVSDLIPEGLYIEPVTSWSIGIYWEEN